MNMSTNTRDSFQLAAAVLAMLAGIFATLLFVNPAEAAESADAPRQIVVNFADLNLSSNEGAAVLYRRIQDAAVQVCGPVDSRELARAAAAKACVNHAVTEALVAVNSPVVTHRYFATTARAEVRLADSLR